MDTIIKNGIIITAAETFKADIAVNNGKIHAIGADLGTDAGSVYDAEGKYVLPGAVDAHVHLQLPVGSAVSADTYESGTRAAACGGVTTVFDFALQGRGEGLLDNAKKMISVFKQQACIDFALHTAVTDIDMVTVEEIKKSIDFGITSFKLYMVYKDIMSDDGALFEMLQMSRETGALIAVHAENPAIIERRIKKLLEAGKTDAWHHYESRPEFVEAEAIKRAVYLAIAAGSKLYIVHLACKEGMEEVIKARSEGYPVIAETCPHYLNFTNKVYKRPDGRNFVCSPALKGAGSRDALWEGIKNGHISTVATDHCPFQSYEKDYGIDDFTKIPNGCMGTENMFPYMLGEANKGRITFGRVVELCCTNPAKVFGCAPQKGTLCVGSDADIVIYDPRMRFKVTKDNMHSNVDYTIWEGYEMKGYPVMTFSRGRLVYDNGRFMGEPGRGQFVRCRIS
jgi:dihydropyrimidinase